MPDEFQLVKDKPAVQDLMVALSDFMPTLSLREFSGMAVAIHNGIRAGVCNSDPKRRDEFPAVDYLNHDQNILAEVVNSLTVDIVKELKSTQLKRNDRVILSSQIKGVRGRHGVLVKVVPGGIFGHVSFDGLDTLYFVPMESLKRE